MGTARAEKLIIGVPSLYCPFPFSIHPRTEVLQRRTLTWMEKHEFFRLPRVQSVVDGSSWVKAAGLTWPVGDDLGMRVIADWSMIIRALDTLVFENNGASETSARMEASTSRAAARLVRLLEVPDSELLADNDPFLAPWRDVARRFNATATPAQRHRWIDGHRSMLTAVTWERVYVVSNEIPTLNEYASIRMHTIGVGPVRAAIEFTRCIDVPDEEMYSPVVQAINEAWGLLAGWDNDLFSYSRHRMLNGGREPVLNLVGLLILTHGYSLQDAFLHAVELRNRVMRLIVRLRAQIMPLASPDLRAYLTGVVCAIRGSLDWYNQRQVEGSSSVDGLDSAPDLELTVQLTDISAPDADKPIDMPAIAWWWDLLEG